MASERGAPVDDQPMSPPTVHRNPTVVAIGVASLLSDAGHEMATAALPGFLRSLATPAVALGAIEGIADAALSVSKVAGGAVADRPGTERRRLTAAGYALTAMGHGSFALASVWPAVAVARAVSWIARGGKAPARDSLLAASVTPSQLGRAFGLERAMDSIGAIAGPLLAAPLLVAVGYRWLFAVSMVPGLLAAIAVLAFVREAPRAVRVTTGLVAPWRALVGTPGPFQRLLAGVGLYGLGNFSATLLVLHATEVLADHGRPAGPAAAVAVLLYAAHNAANALAAYPAGAVADRIGRRPVLIAGVALFGISCGLFALGPTGVMTLGVLFVAVGASTGLVETAQGAHAAELLAPEVRGRGFGVLGLVDGVGDLVSSVVVGTLFTVGGPSWGFAYAALLAGAAVVVLARKGVHP